MVKKYEFTGQVNAQGLKRIRALIDLPRRNIKAGDEGGWIEKEENLSQEGDCWVGVEARVFDNARVIAGAIIGGKASVAEYALVTGTANIYGAAALLGRAHVGNDAYVGGDAVVRYNAAVIGSASVYGNARICDHARIFDYAEIKGMSIISGYSNIGGNISLLNKTVNINGTFCSIKELENALANDHAINQEILESDSKLAEELLKMKYG